MDEVLEYFLSCIAHQHHIAGDIQIYNNRNGRGWSADLKIRNSRTGHVRVLLLCIYNLKCAGTDLPQYYEHK